MGHAGDRKLARCHGRARSSGWDRLFASRGRAGVPARRVGLRQVADGRRHHRHSAGRLPQRGLGARGRARGSAPARAAKTQGCTRRPGLAGHAIGAQSAGVDRRAAGGAAAPARRARARGGQGRGAGAVALGRSAGHPRLSRNQPRGSVGRPAPARVHRLGARLPHGPDRRRRTHHRAGSRHASQGSAPARRAHGRPGAGASARDARSVGRAHGLRARSGSGRRAHRGGPADGRPLRGRRATISRASWSPARWPRPAPSPRPNSRRRNARWHSLRSTRTDRSSARAPWR